MQNGDVVGSSDEGDAAFEGRSDSSGESRAGRKCGEDEDVEEEGSRGDESTEDQDGWKEVSSDDEKTEDEE